MKDRVAVQFEEYYPAFDKWFEETAYPFDDGIATHTHDITDGKRAEQSLQESETRYLALLASFDGFCVIEMLLDEDGDARNYHFLVKSTVMKTRSLPSIRPPGNQSYSREQERRCHLGDRASHRQDQHPTGTAPRLGVDSCRRRSRCHRHGSA
jgi:hypothetical protein